MSSSAFIRQGCLLAFNEQFSLFLAVALGTVLAGTSTFTRACGMVSLVANSSCWNASLTTIETNPQARVKVDVPAQTVTNETTGNSEHFELNAYQKHCLMNAYDAIDFLLAGKDKIEQWEAAQEK